MTRLQRFWQSLRPRAGWLRAGRQKAATEAAPLPGGDLGLPICCQGWVRVCGEGVRRRLDPDPGARILGVWAAGEELAVWGKCGDWWLVVNMGSGAWGWSHSRYLAPRDGVNGAASAPLGARRNQPIVRGR